MDNRPGPVLGPAQLVERAPGRVLQLLDPGSGAEDVPAGGAEHLAVRAAEGPAKIRRRRALGAEARGKDRAVDRREVQVKLRQRRADGGADHEAH